MTEAENQGQKFEKIIGTLLIGGVLLSLIFAAAGIIFFLAASGDVPLIRDPSVFISGKNFFSYLSMLFHGQGHMQRPILWMAIGICILIVTPYVRVVFTVVYFGWKKNIPFLLITLFVLIVITISLATH